jgi:pimeloyl-ACP methyl ester carboxylesterase
MTDPRNHEPQQAHSSWWQRYRLLTILGVLTVVSVLTFILVIFTPLFDRDLTSSPDPAPTYTEAMSRVTEIVVEPEEINSVCGSRVFEHGQRMAQSVVLLHGYTNCPAQFRSLAAAYFDAGYNVVSLRLPAHGYRDRLTGAMSDLYPADLTESADAAVDIAAGLGEEVSVVGLSAGGTLAAWLAAQRDDVDTAVLIAPLMVPKILPEIAVAPVARLARYIPDYYVWWDNNLKAELRSPPYAYPRFSIRSMGALLAVGRFAQGNVTRTQPLQKVVIITTDVDAAVSNAAVTDMGEALAGFTEEFVVISFPESDGYSHDLIDPTGDNRDRIVDIYTRIGPDIGIPQLSTTTDPGL